MVLSPAAPGCLRSSRGGGRASGRASLRLGTVLQRVMMKLIRLSRPPEDCPVFSPRLPTCLPSASLLPHPARLTDLCNHALPIHTCVPALTCFILLSPSSHVLLHSLVSRSLVSRRTFPHCFSSFCISKSALQSTYLSIDLSIRLSACLPPVSPPLSVSLSPPISLSPFPLHSLLPLLSLSIHPHLFLYL